MTTTAPPRRKAAAGPGLGWASSMVAADRRGVGRILVMALGIGLCALVLLALFSIGPAIDRSAARNELASPAFDEGAPTAFQYSTIGFATDAGRVNGLRLTAGADPTPPPGVAAFPKPGELYVSPDLAAALASDQGAAIRALLPGTVVGTIDPAALPGPHDLFFYAGTDLGGDLPAAGWGAANGAAPLDLRIWMLLVTGTTIIAVPLLMFVALSARLGGARRDRRTAVLRLLGATRAQVLLLSALEAFLASLAGLALAACGYLALRRYAVTIQVDGRGLQTSDIAPTWAGAVAIAVGVPVLAIAAAVLGGVRTTDRTSAMPAGSTRPVRAWWRLALLGAAVAVGWWAVRRHGHGSSYSSDIRDTAVLCAVVATTMFSVAALTGLLTDRIARASARGPLAWLLARRRLAQDGTLITRPAAALCTVLAGTIALSGILTTTLYADQARDANSVQYYGYVALDGLTEWQQLDRSMSTAGGVQSVAISGDLAYGDPYHGDPTMVVGTCGYVWSFSPGIPCTDGDTFRFARPPATEPLSHAPYRLDSVATRSAPVWTPPADTRVIESTVADSVSDSGGAPDFVLTPGAAQQQFPGSLEARTDNYVNVRFVVDGGRVGPAQQATGWLGDRAAGVYGLSSAAELGSSAVPWVSAALIACGIVTLLISALGQWLTTAQQMTDRRRAFALARASGLPVGTLMRSFVVAALAPVLVGTVLAVAAGITLIHVLRYLRDDQPPAALPWNWIVATVAIGVFATLLIALGSAWRLRVTTGPRAMRTE